MSKEETRKKILEAAEKLFQKNGYDGVPTKAIAKEAGITEMTLFNHFPKKQLLYKTVVKERYLAVEIRAVLSELGYDDLEKDLKKISKKLITNFVYNKPILMMRLKEKQSFRDDAAFEIEQDPILKQITPVFETYFEKGLIKTDGKRTALLFISAFKGMCYIYLLEGKEQKRVEELIDDFITIFCYGLIT